MLNKKFTFRCNVIKDYVGSLEQTRTVTPIGHGFSYHYSFHYQPKAVCWSGLYLHLREMGTVKSLHLPQFPKAWLGISSLKPSPNLTPSTLEIAFQALKFSSSPLCLPFHHEATYGLIYIKFYQKEIIIMWSLLAKTVLPSVFATVDRVIS